jgi:hypothetical protein
MAAAGTDQLHSIHVYCDRGELTRWQSHGEFQREIIAPLDAAIFQRQMISIEPALGYAQVGFSNGVGIIRCVTAEHHDRIKALLEELGFGPHINRPPDVPTEDLRQVMQFMRSANVTGSLDPFLSMLINYYNLEGIISLVSDRSQQWGEDWGRSVLVLVPSVAVQRILDNRYRLRGPMGDLYFYSRVIKAHKKAAERAEWSRQREAAEAEATANNVWPDSKRPLAYQG